MKNRQPCIHGDLCREIYKLTGCIYSVRCPYGCKYYETVNIVKEGILWDEKYRKNSKLR